MCVMILRAAHLAARGRQALASASDALTDPVATHWALGGVLVVTVERQG
jgi:hypothetical protein